MNYFIQGDITHCSAFKNRFAELGFKTNGCEFADYDCLYFTANGQVCSISASGPIANIIKTHPDYQELELPVEPMFKDGDVLVTTKIRSCPFIYRKTSYKNNLAYYYVGINGNGDLTDAYPKNTLCHFGLASDVVPATKEQRDLLFQKIKEAGYEWDAEKKELRKIQPHYDISNFHAGMPVLVRADNVCRWNYSVFSHITGNKDWQFAVCNGISFTQCIPFEGNEKLLGTTDMCPEEYINW